GCPRVATAVEVLDRALHQVPSIRGGEEALDVPVQRPEGPGDATPITEIEESCPKPGVGADGAEPLGNRIEPRHGDRRAPQFPVTGSENHVAEPGQRPASDVAVPNRYGDGIGLLGGEAA